MKKKTVLVISGLDPTGGAGLSADIRAVTSVGLVTAPIITAIANQSHCRGGSVHIVDPNAFSESMDFALSTHPGAIKIGMLGSKAIIEITAQKLEAMETMPPMVIDPVMFSTSGMKLLSEGGRIALVDRLFPMATLITPNISEAGSLTGMKISSERDIVEAGNSLAQKCRAVLIKGGHIDGAPIDYLFKDDGMCKFSDGRIAGEFRGTGCALASLIASNLAIGNSLPNAIGQAKESLTKAMRESEPPYIIF